MTTRLHTTVQAVCPLGEPKKQKWVYAKWMQEDDDGIKVTSERNDK